MNPLLGRGIMRGDYPPVAQDCPPLAMPPTRGNIVRGTRPPNFVRTGVEYRLIEIWAEENGVLTLESDDGEPPATINHGREQIIVTRNVIRIPPWGYCCGTSAGMITVTVTPDKNSFPKATWGVGWPRWEMQPQRDVIVPAAAAYFTGEPPKFAVMMKICVIDGALSPTPPDDWCAAANRGFTGDVVNGAIVSLTWWVQAP